MPQRRVGVAIAAAVEPMPVGLAGGDLDRGRAAERGVGTFVAQPLGVVAGGDEELPGGVVADTVHGDERGGDVIENGFDAPVECSDLDPWLVTTRRPGSPAPRGARGPPRTRARVTRA
jgi:hypothetical protein